MSPEQKQAAYQALVDGGADNLTLVTFRRTHGMPPLEGLKLNNQLPKGGFTPRTQITDLRGVEGQADRFKPRARTREKKPRKPRPEKTQKPGDVASRYDLLGELGEAA